MVESTAQERVSRTMDRGGLRTIVGMIREDYRVHNRQLSSPGFRALFWYRIDSWRNDLSNPLVRRPLTVLCLMATRWIRNHHGIELPPTARIGRRLHLLHWGGVVLHKYATVGDDCVILHEVTVGAAGDVQREKAPKLGDGVQLGVGAVVLGAVQIGDRARIGPNAVVTMDVPADGTAFADPARVIHAPAVPHRQANR